MNKTRSSNPPTRAHGNTPSGIRYYPRHFAEEIFPLLLASSPARQDQVTLSLLADDKAKESAELLLYLAIMHLF